MAQEISLLYTGYHRVGWLRLIRADYRETAWEVLGSSREFSGNTVVVPGSCQVGLTILGRVMDGISKPIE